jgi:glycosyltransferase involved in cell wall biosynthesis
MDRGAVRADWPHDRLGGAYLSVRVAAFTAGAAIPSARFRVRQFIEPLTAEGIAVHELGNGGGGSYPPAAKWQRPLWAMTRLAALVPDVLSSRGDDVVLLQREMLSSFATLERFTGRPRIFDVDDAIHLLRGGTFARRIVQGCDQVIAGNDYLAEWYGQWNRRVTVLPTAIDTERYLPAPRGEDDTLRIGWIGTSGNFPYLQAIEPALERAMAERPNLHLLVMADRAPHLPTLHAARVRFQTWSEAGEVAALQAMDIGVMPLPDDLWTRGKCSFKMLQYMACGVPVVVSPTGMNAQVLAGGEIGFGPADGAQWTEALLALIDSAELRRRMGSEGRRLAESTYSVHTIAPRLAQILRGT